MLPPLIYLILFSLPAISSITGRQNQARNQPVPRQQQGNRAQNALIPNPQKAVAKYQGGRNLWSQAQARGRQRDDPPKGDRQWTQKKSCRPGRAMIDLSWTEQAAGHRKYSIKCENFTQSCQEKCMYALACTVKQFGQNLYVRGMYSIYDIFEEHEKYFLFLCCNTTIVPEGRKCTNKKQLKTSGPMQTAGQYSFRESSSTYPDGITQESLKGAGKFYFELCFNVRPKKGIILCPLYAQYLAQQASSSSVQPAFDPALSVKILRLIGEVRTGAGLSIKKCPMTRPCCCQCPPACSGNVWSHYRGACDSTLEACILTCLSDVECVAIHFYVGKSGATCDNACFLSSAANIAQGAIFFASSFYCYKC